PFGFGPLFFLFRGIIFLAVVLGLGGFLPWVVLAFFLLAGFLFALFAFLCLRRFARLIRAGVFFLFLRFLSSLCLAFLSLVFCFCGSCSCAWMVTLKVWLLPSLPFFS